ncbi:polyprenyl synthetase family protein [Streptomyces sp. NPDC056534]|uniref:polyprenyl synthetase family protein n=1 Tax=Streptomyces sp. NPDC056534 TaxID=3345857 RepID=UPI00368AC706
MPSLREAVSRLTPPVNRIAAYHFGWAHGDGQPTEAADQGSGIRPALALLSAQAVGADPSAGIPGGVAVELVHNSSLLHDDFIDGSETRRSRPTAWSIFGPAQAVLAGDALFAIAPDVLFRTSGATQDSARAVKLLTQASCRIADGRALDMLLRLRWGVSVDECIEMAAGKTAALFACASSIGAVLGGGDDSTVHSLERYGYHLGLTFQAVDDLLGIWGSPEATGRPRWNDLRRRKKSLPVCAALAQGSAKSQQISELLITPRGFTSEDDIKLALCVSLIEQAGGRDWAKEEAHRQCDAALTALEDTDMPAAVREHLHAIAAHTISRVR